MKEIIYLDHAAATPMSDKVQNAMQPFLSDYFFNPSSPYLPAVEVRRAFEEAKASIAACIGAKSDDIVMTAGATESISLAFSNISSEALALEIEHEAVLSNLMALPAGRTIKVKPNGIIDIDDLKVKITDKTELVSVGLINSELGTIQPLAEVGRIIKEERLNRLKNGNRTPIYLHSDASQAAGLINLNVSRLGVDLMTLNAGKVYGPKQVGLLWISPGVLLKPIVRGGGQEMGLRSGTENVAGTIGFAVALKEAKKHQKSEIKRLEKLKMSLKDRLASGIENIRFLGDVKKQLVSFLPISISGVDAERLIFILEQDGVLVSTGSACAANKAKVSHVLSAINLSESEISGSLRISLGKLNTDENIILAGDLIIKAVNSEKHRTGITNV